MTTMIAVGLVSDPPDLAVTSSVSFFIAHSTCIEFFFEQNNLINTKHINPYQNSMGRFS
jgi:hypothetical protein